MNILINSNIQQAITDYYVNSKDYKGSKLYFSENTSTVDYCILKKNTTDEQWYVTTSGNLKGYSDNGQYLYQFDFDKYISFDANKTINPFDYNEIDFRFQGNSSSQMYFLSSINGNSVQDNIYDNYFTLLDDGRIRVNDISDVASYNCDLLVHTNFWNREDGTIYNYPIQNVVEKNSYFPITIYGDYDAYVILKDIDGNILKRKTIENGTTYDFSTNFIWIPENCESIDIYKYNSSGYNEILNDVQPNLLNDSALVKFFHNQDISYLNTEYKDDEVEPYYRITPIAGQIFRANGASYAYNDIKALYVVSFDIRVQNPSGYAQVSTKLDMDDNDSYRIATIDAYKWNRMYTMPFSTTTTQPLIITNESVDRIARWVDIKNVKIEKVKFNKYVNFIGKYEASNLYGFARDKFYLQAGKKYTLRVVGNNSNATLGRRLYVEIASSPQFIGLDTSEFSGDFVKTITFTANFTAQYSIYSLYYPQNANTTGSVYLASYYLYEGTIDPGETIIPSDYIPSVNDMENQTNYKSFSKSVTCPGVVSNDYFYLDNNSVMDKLSCKANAFEVESVEKEYVKLGNKNYNNKTAIKKQIVQNTGYQLDEKQVYSLNKSPLVYKIKPKNYLINPNYVYNTNDVYTINTANTWTIIPLNYNLVPGKEYYFQVDIIQDDASNITEFRLGNDTNNDHQTLTPNSSFIFGSNVIDSNLTELKYFQFVNRTAYKPLVVRNIMITEGEVARQYEKPAEPHFEMKNYQVDNTSFDGYIHKQLNEKNIEIILTDIESVTKKNNIKTTFFD